MFLAKSHLTTLVSQVRIWKPLLGRSTERIPCDSFTQKLIWEAKLPHAMSGQQNSITSVDVDNDTIADVIIGFDSGLWSLLFILLLVSFYLILFFKIMFLFILYSFHLVFFCCDLLFVFFCFFLTISKWRKCMSMSESYSWKRAVPTHIGSYLLVIVTIIVSNYYSIYH